MKFATEVPIDGGGSILIELPGDSRFPSPEGLIPAGATLDKARQAAAQASVVVLEEASTSLNQSLDSITDFAKALRSALRAASPDDVEAEFGFDLTVQGGAPLLVHGSAGCHVKIKLSWHASANADAGKTAD